MMTKFCRCCDEPISEKRLMAVPEADTCVTCLQESGDVERIRRHDDHVGKDGETVVEVYFTRPNQYLKQHLDKLNNRSLICGRPEHWSHAA